MNVEQYSLADFFWGDGRDPLVPPQEFTAWREDERVAAASSLYEPMLLTAPLPRAEIETLWGKRSVINLSSYNYLGLAGNPEMVQAGHEALDTYGIGACGSPILSGMTDLHRRLETYLSKFLGREDTMLFNSGFSGVLGVLSGVLRKGDVAVLDSKSHYSLIDGATLAKARIEFFEHNDPQSLDEVLTRHKDSRRLICIEGIYSMDGDIADLPALYPVAEAHGVQMIIDEAHSIFTCGQNGRGVVEHFDMEGRGGLQYGTFSKALAGLGGFASGDRSTIDYLRCYARSYAFSCALPPVVVAALLKGLEIATRDNTLRQKLWENTDYFRAGLQRLGLDYGASNSQVIPIIIGTNREALYNLGHEMRERGLFLAPVDYPAVPQDQVRFRASVTALHTREDLDEALNILNDTVVKWLRCTR